MTRELSKPKADLPVFCVSPPEFITLRITMARSPVRENYADGCGNSRRWQDDSMTQTIEGAFAAYWKNLLAKDAKLATYPKSFQALLKDAFEMGYKVGSTDRQIEIEAHREN
jgi:hypothetical protein